MWVAWIEPFLNKLKGVLCLFQARTSTPLLMDSKQYFPGGLVFGKTFAILLRQRKMNSSPGLAKESDSMRSMTKWLAVFCAAGILGMAAAQAEGNLRYSITVSKFPNESGWSGQWNLGDGFATILTDVLQQSQKFIVLGDAEMRQEAMAEQDLVASGRMAGGKKAPQVGRMTPAQLLVRGSITHVQNDTAGGGGGLSFKGFRIGGNASKAEVNITIYLVDSETGQVKASQKVVGKAGGKGVGIGYSGSALGGLGGDMEGFMKDNMGKACEDAVVQCVDFLTKQLESIPWEGSVMLVSDSKIVINRGTREGVAVGQQFQVGKTEELIDEDTGEVLDSEMTTVGNISVTEAKEKIAYCSPLAGVEKGMSVVPVK
jgi:curli biogenesis system outer membrane secretion channel CsgG